MTMKLMPLFSAAASIAALCATPNAHAACPSIANRFAASAAEVLDTQTGLVWARCSVGQSWGGTTCTGSASTLTHEAALARAHAQTGWRLPNIKELASLVDRGCHSPAIDGNTFPNTPSTYYWSTTGNDTLSALIVNFADGSASSAARYDGYGYPIRLIRVSPNSQGSVSPTNPAQVPAVVPLGPAPSVKAERLPHSGFTAAQCFAAGSDALVSCNSTEALSLNSQQDGMRAGVNAMAYSQVANPAAAGQFFAKTECMKDNVTGLTWEGKPADGGMRDYRKTYGVQSSGSDPLSYEVAVNAASLCGKNDWRLPTVREFGMLVDYGKSPLDKAYTLPMVDLNAFPNTALQYWVVFPSPNGNSIEIFDFGRGVGGLAPTEYRSRYLLPVRLVRGGQ